MLPHGKAGCAIGLQKPEKKCHMKNTEKLDFPEARPLILQFDIFLIVLYVLFDFTFTQLDCTRLQRQSKGGTLVSGKKGDFLSFPPPQPVSHCIDVSKSDCIWIILGVF